MVLDRHFQYMLFLIKSASTLTLTHPWDRDSVSVELKEREKYICLLITQHFSVNNISTLSVFFGYLGVLSHQTIAISKIMSMSMVLQIFLGCVVIWIKGILKHKSETDLRQSKYGYFISEMITHNSLNTIISKNLR